jgi:hypothetical protein
VEGKYEALPALIDKADKRDQLRKDANWYTSETGTNKYVRLAENDYTGELFAAIEVIRKALKDAGKAVSQQI